MKVGYNYTGYKMVKQKGSWNSPNNINVSSFDKTDHGYILFQKLKTFVR